MRVRGHHLVCTYCFYGSGKRTAAEFFGNDNAIPHLLAKLQANPDLELEVADDLDDVCRECCNYAPGECRRSPGDPVAQNEKLRDWDRRILQRLGLRPGDRITARELERRIRSNIPDISVICTNCTSAAPSGWREFREAIAKGLWGD